MIDSCHSKRGAQGMKDALRCAIAEDDARPSLPYEHVATLAAGLALAACALRVPGRPLAVAQAVLAGALLFRAAAGRDGLRQWAGADKARPAVGGRAADPEADASASGYAGA